MQTRTPYDPAYAALIGTAVYIFAYYEWEIVYIIEQFRRGFLDQYCRGTPMTCGDIANALKKILDDSMTSYPTVSKTELQACLTTFEQLCNRRNKLLHAHPITDTGRSQILNYQGRVDRALSDIKWSTAEIEAVIREFDDAACAANSLLHRFHV